MKEHYLEIDKETVIAAKDFLRAEGVLLEKLGWVDERRVFEKLNYPSLFSYCTHRLKLSESTTSAYISVVRKSRSVPELKQAVVEGILSVSQAKRIVSVIAPESAHHWIQEASTKKQRELEKAVARSLPEPRPSSRIRSVGGEMSKLTLVVPERMRKKVERLMEVRGISLLEAVDFALTETLSRHDPMEKAKRNHNKPKKAPRSSRRGKRTPIPAQVAHEVRLRDQGQCTATLPEGKRCENQRWLHFHHIQEISRGGPHTVSNLTLRCSAHHAMIHRVLPSGT